MDSLVIELQKVCVSSKASVSDIVRKAYLVAQKLGDTEKLEWITSELNGYGDNQQIPGYRQFKGQLKGLNPYHGWQPILFFNEDKEIYERAVNCRVNSAIGEIESIKNSEITTMYEFPLDEDIKSYIQNNLDYETDVKLFLNKSSVPGICETVKNTILTWSLELEKKGILGEGMTFSDNEKNLAPSINIGNIGHFTGSIGHNSGQFCIGDNNTINNLEQVRNLMDQITKSIDELALNEERKRNILDLQNSICNELDSSNPDKQLVSSSLTDLRTIFISIGSNLISSGIVYEINKLLGIG